MSGASGRTVRSPARQAGPTVVHANRSRDPKLCLRTNTDDELVLGALPSAILALGPRRVGEPSRRASRPSAWVALSDQGDLALAFEILAPALLRILTVVSCLSSAAATSLPGNSRNSSQKRCAAFRSLREMRATSLRG